MHISINFYPENKNPPHAEATIVNFSPIHNPRRSLRKGWGGLIGAKLRWAPPKDQVPDPEEKSLDLTHTVVRREFVIFWYIVSNPTMTALLKLPTNT